MPDDLKVIAKIEKTIGKKLKELPGGKIDFVTNGFALDDGGRVVGLNLLGCKFTDISALQSLTQLKTLDLCNNQLTDISPLQWLTQLKNLYLYNNQLTDISVLQSLTQLKKLDLGNNKITRLPTFIAQWNMEIKWERGYAGYGVNLSGNPLETPPVEIVKQGRKAVRNYFAELEKAPPEKAEVLLLQAKLLFVGSGEVGKTTLMRTLTEPRFKLKKRDIGKEPTTHGIRIKPWPLTCPLEADTQPSRQLTLHTWDFGARGIGIRWCTAVAGCST